MKRLKILLIIFEILICVMTLFSQSSDSPIKRNGFVIGFSVGGGVSSISDSYRDVPFEEAQGVFSFPHLKVGWMLSGKTALLASYHGALYDKDGKDRSFDALLPSVQYWAGDNWWLNVGFGLAMDTPALYEDNIKNDSWNFGSALSLGTGIELIQKRNFVMDINSNLLLGRVNLDDGVSSHRDGVVFTLALGFNWY